MSREQTFCLTEEYEFEVTHHHFYITMCAHLDLNSL